MRLGLAAAIGLCGMVTAAGAGEEPAAAPFPIMAWDYVDDEAIMRSMAECGINAVAFVPEAALDACAKHGLKAIVYDPELTPARWDLPFRSEGAIKALPNLIRRVDGHPAVMGYHLKDEPDPGQFAELGKAVAEIRRLAPGKWPYINLLPGKGKDYDAYVDHFVKACDPTIISYDNYALAEDGSFGDGYWSNLAQVQAASRRHSRPFHVIMLSVAHFAYAVPTEATLQLQAYGALAYGAKGLGWYKFISREVPILAADDLGNWRGGPLNEFLEKSPNWEVMRRLNRKIQNLGPTMLKLRPDAAYHIGEVPDENRGPADGDLLKGMLSGTSFLVGEFTHEDDGARWMMIVNKDLKRSIPCRPDFRTPMKVQYLSPITGELKNFPDPWYYLAPGQGVLLRLTPREG